MQWERTELKGRTAPCRVFEAVCSQPGAILLESQRPSFLERHSLVAWEPVSVFQGDLPNLGKKLFFHFLDTYSQDHLVCGYMGYETCQWIEKLPVPAQPKMPNPTIYLAAYDRFLMFDRVLKQWHCWHQNAPLSFPKGNFKRGRWTRGAMSGFDQDKTTYLKNVRQVLEYIKAGEIYQTNYTQRVHYTYDGGPYELYLRLKRIQPVSFGAFINLGDGGTVISGSPELFLRVTGRTALSKPMKGTRKRSRRDTTDRKLRKELKTSRKDLAENTMIVDVMRNDLGRCCEYGSISVPRPYVVEAYDTVYQMVSHVRGTIRSGFRPSDIVRAAFPPASITGAPKVRAMEVISELEPSQRGVYCGTIGYFFRDKIVMNVAIRTLELRDGTGVLGVGGGIVADSDPESEYAESILKAKASLMALGIG
jgi:para-aminobenzoate synthetase component 1